MIHQSRQDFEQNFEKLMAEAKKLSLEQDFLAQENQHIENELLQKDIQEAIDQSNKGIGGQAQTEEEMLKLAMMQSMSQLPKKEQEVDDEALLKQVLEQSRNDVVPL